MKIYKITEASINLKAVNEEIQEKIPQDLLDKKAKIEKNLKAARKAMEKLLR